MRPAAGVLTALAMVFTPASVEAASSYYKTGLPKKRKRN